MRIDLHCHTKAIKKGDGPGRNVTPEQFKSKVEDADVKIVAITNHNAFDLEQYRALSIAVEGNCDVWPGVEIDVLEPGSRSWHLIIVANPNEADSFSKNVDDLFRGDNLDTCRHTLDEIHNAFKDSDAIYIAHFHGKSPSVPEDDADKLERLVGDPHRVFKETANENSMSIFAYYHHNVLVGSDVKDWNNYEKCTFSELKLPVDSFEQFCLLAKRDDVVVQTLLDKKDSRRMIAHPNPSVELCVRIYADMNIIFGQKGTGKTEIVKSLYSKMQADGFNCVKYVATDNEGDIHELLNKGGLQPDAAKMGLNDCVDCFQTLFSWRDTNPTLFSNYLNWKKTEGLNANKTRMRITHASAMVKDEQVSTTKHRQDKENVDAINSKIDQIHTEDYLGQEKSKRFIELFGELKGKIYQSRLVDLIDEEANRLINFTINKIKEIADRNTNSVSKPSSTGLCEFAEARIKLFKAVNEILNNLQDKEIYEKERFGTLDEKGDIFITTRYRILRHESRTDEFKNGIKQLRESKSKLISIVTQIFDRDVSESVQETVNLCRELEIESILPYIGISRFLTNSDSQQYIPSNGEKAMLLLQKTIMQDVDAYFLDEPELGMGNSYIDTAIRPVLMDLSIRRKYVVVATHDANIGVRSLPYNSIYRTHSNGKYTTYIGNPFSNKLVNIDDESDILNWAEESMKSLEGGKEAFYERKDIYESNHS